MRDRLPIGVIGVGALGTHHARHLAALPDAALVGVHDIDHARGSLELGIALNRLSFSPSPQRNPKFWRRHNS
jgi:predicted dehydrogenase